MRMRQQTPRAGGAVRSGVAAGGRRGRCEPAALFRALADETRLEILRVLDRRGGELCACEIEAHFDLAQPTISHHLRLLREAGLVGAERRGTWVYHSLDRGGLRRLDAVVGRLTRGGPAPPRSR